MGPLLHARLCTMRQHCSVPYASRGESSLVPEVLPDLKATAPGESIMQREDIVPYQPLHALCIWERCSDGPRVLSVVKVTSPC